MKSKHFIQENVKNCTIISHFASTSGKLRPPNPQTSYRGFALDNTEGRKSEADLEGPSRLQPPVGRRTDAVTHGTHDM